ncbi:MAG: dicarboxylate/amino acid:cation symporter [Verrucomicrobiae bacterium]|nr:dicarboxylate/amino acid:cation symporter [Verrucomicrobiae bacterium]
MKKLFGLSLTKWIFIGLFGGIAFGYFAPPEWSVALKPMGLLFIRLIKMIVAPLVFASLVTGLVGAGNSHIGRLLLKALVWFWLATAAALAIGLVAANVLRPGEGAHLAPVSHGEVAPLPPKHRGVIEQVVPESVFQALAGNELLQIVFFAILFALGLSAVGTKADPVVDFLNGVTAAMFKVTEYVMYFAPIGVACAIAAAIGAHGVDVLLRLAKLVGSLYVALFFFVAALLLLVKWYTRIRVGRALFELREPLTLAFSTTSSESALPKAIESMERLGVPPHIVNFVIPAGYSFNLDGTTLYLAMATGFIAQASHVEMTLSQQIVMMLTLLVTSKGVAAVPRASLVVLSATCVTYGLPLEMIAVIIGVDEVMDMARTTVNVLGNCMASVVIAKSEKALAPDSLIFQRVRHPGAPGAG